MKVMAINRNTGQHIDMPIDVDMIPDSAILRDGKPFFIPDFASQWTACPVIAYRIHRLGKNIAGKFAPRYYDAITLGVRMVPQDLMDKLRTGNLSTGIATSFDGAFIHGEWLPIDKFNVGPLNISIGSVTATVCRQKTEIDAAIELLSKFYTFKIGDIVIPYTVTDKLEVKIDSSVSGSINDTQCINFRIK